MQHHAECTDVKPLCIVTWHTSIQHQKNMYIHSYNSDTEEWSTLPDCPRYYFTLTVVNGYVTAVGGSEFIWVLERNSLTHCSVSLRWKVEGRIERRSFHPCQPTKRKLTGKTLVVAGGYGEEYTTLTYSRSDDTDTL